MWLSAAGPVDMVQVAGYKLAVITAAQLQDCYHTENQHSY